MRGSDASAPGPRSDAMVDGVGAAVLVSVQHELRTPLTILHVTNETLLGIVDDPAVRGLIEAQQRALVQLSKLVDGVLDVTELVADGCRLDPQEPVEVAAQVDEVALDLRSRVASIVIDSSACRGVWAMTVAPLFRLLLRCLLEDQLAFGKGAPVHVGAESTTGELRLWLRSSDPQRHTRESTTYSPHGGHGLNVLAASFLAERLGGGIETPTTERDELRVRLPQRRLADQDVATPAAEAAGA